jgi:hypothetical protein
MRSAEELRTEVRRLHETINNLTDPALKRELAARALELAEQAEAIAKMGEDPEIVCANIERYRRMLSAGIDDDTQRAIIEELLHNVERVLERTKKPTR